ncbi:MAG: hypothetical protein HUU28_03395 [Planctomycetaceae bacterium]|nr:hypothetical protein [Planctomycetaceae bacterium]
MVFLRTPLAISLTVLAATTAPALGQTTLFHETFENGLGNWTESPPLSVSRWQRISESNGCAAGLTPFPSSNKALRFGLPDTVAPCTFENAGNSNLILNTPIDIPAGAQHVRLHYWSFEETECVQNEMKAGNCGWDERFVSVSSNGGATWTDVALGGEEGAWRQVSVDLSAYAGQSLLLRLRFASVDWWLNEYRGWFLDEIKLEYGVPGPVTYCTATVTGLATSFAPPRCSPILFHSGSPSLTGPDDLVIGARQLVNQSPARILWSRAPASTPFLGATLCLAAPIVRTPLASSGGNTAPVLDCSGMHQFHFSESYLAANFLTAGDTFYLQFSGRDPTKPGPENRSASAALQLTVLP